MSNTKVKVQMIAKTLKVRVLILILGLILTGCGLSGTESAMKNSSSETVNLDTQIVANEENSILEPTLSAPEEGDVLSGSAVLEASAPQPDRIASLQFRWDSEDLGAPITNPPFTFEWKTTDFEDGFYTLTFLVNYVDGSEMISDPVTVKVGNRVSSVGGPGGGAVGNGKAINVPGDFPTIQAAIDEAESGDLVIVAPGTYNGGLVIDGKSITLASRFMNSKDENDKEQTIIQGGEPSIFISESALNSQVIGLTLMGGRKGVTCFSDCEVRDNIFDNVGSDALSLEDCGGLVVGNTFISPSDDGIDIDGPGETLILGNTIRDAGDDGIEIRNFNYSGQTRTVVMRGNTILDSEEDGVQIIDYDQNSDRVFVLEENLIMGSVDVGLGIMDQGETREDFRGASIPERIHVFHNTFVNNTYGITGGDNLVAVNNLFVGSSQAAIRRSDGDSRLAYNLFWQNTMDSDASNVDRGTSVFMDPDLANDFSLMSGSPAVDQGAKSFTYKNEIVFNRQNYKGAGPDLGFQERP